MLENYLPVLVFIGVGLVVGVVMVALGFVLGTRRPDSEKLSPYECGFEAFEDARMKFDVRYYLVAILFIIFDLEIAFLFPWAIVLGKIGLVGSLEHRYLLAQPDHNHAPQSKSSDSIPRHWRRTPWR